MNGTFTRGRRTRPALLLRGSVLAGLCLLPSSSLLAQEAPVPLAEIAKKEHERRKTLKVPSIVFTQKDVRPAPPAPAAAPALPPDAPPAAEPSAPKSDDPATQEAQWRERMAAAREELRRNEMFADALQSRINGLGRDFVNRDDPYQQARIGEDRQKALAELTRVQAEIVSGRARIAGIEEEARRAGIPAGWLR